MDAVIIQYGVCSANDVATLAGYVNEQIAGGWQPHGQAFTTVHFEQQFIHQPMVLIDSKKKINRKL